MRRTVNITLLAGQKLEIGQSLVPSNSLFRLTMQTDGNIVLRGTGIEPGKAGSNSTDIWSTGKQGAGVK